MNHPTEELAEWIHDLEQDVAELREQLAELKRRVVELECEKGKSEGKDN